MAELPRPYQRQLLTEAVPTTDITPFIQSSRRESQALTSALDTLSTVAFQFGKAKKAKQKEANQLLAKQTSFKIYAQLEQDYKVIDDKIQNNEYESFDEINNDLTALYGFPQALLDIDPTGGDADKLLTFIRGENKTRTEAYNKKFIENENKNTLYSVSRTVDSIPHMIETTLSNDMLSPEQRVEKISEYKSLFKSSVIDSSLEESEEKTALFKKLDDNFETTITNFAIKELSNEEYLEKNNIDGKKISRLIREGKFGPLSKLISNKEDFLDKFEKSITSSYLFEEKQNTRLKAEATEEFNKLAFKHNQLKKQLMEDGFLDKTETLALQVSQDAILAQFENLGYDINSLTENQRNFLNENYIVKNPIKEILDYKDKINKGMLGKIDLDKMLQFGDINPDEYKELKETLTTYYSSEKYGEYYRVIQNQIIGLEGDIPDAIFEKLRVQVGEAKNEFRKLAIAGEKEGLDLDELAISIGEKYTSKGVTETYRKKVDNANRFLDELINALEKDDETDENLATLSTLEKLQNSLLDEGLTLSTVKQFESELKSISNSKAYQKVFDSFKDSLEKLNKFKSDMRM